MAVMDLGDYKPEPGERFIYLKAQTAFKESLLFGFINRKGKAEIMDMARLPGGTITGLASVKAVKKGETAVFTLGVYKDGYYMLPKVRTVLK